MRAGDALPPEGLSVCPVEIEILLTNQLDEYSTRMSCPCACALVTMRSKTAHTTGKRTKEPIAAKTARA